MCSTNCEPPALFDTQHAMSQKINKMLRVHVNNNSQWSTTTDNRQLENVICIAGAFMYICNMCSLSVFGSIEKQRQEPASRATQYADEISTFVLAQRHLKFTATQPTNICSCACSFVFQHSWAACCNCKLAVTETCCPTHTALLRFRLQRGDRAARGLTLCAHDLYMQKSRSNCTEFQHNGVDNLYVVCTVLFLVDLALEQIAFAVWSKDQIETGAVFLGRKLKTMEFRNHFNSLFIYPILL